MKKSNVSFNSVSNSPSVTGHDSFAGCDLSLIPGALMAEAPSTGLASATGPVIIPMHNDYLFRALLQRNNRALKGLICSLLHLDDKQVLSVVITNPIELGETIDHKTFFLDVSVILNDYAKINLEMQVINEQNWVERSLSYLCRSFDTLVLHPASNHAFSTAYFAICRVVVSQRCHRIASFLRLAG